ncbi:MAG: 50S ribosomal protein L32 [SAR202 cluster bacterium]|nr:50S ribosomal protein L32 [SAR202 cluster bacterium]
MPPHPKKKHTRARQGGRAAHHFRTAPGLSKCPRCGAASMPHRICKECGYYNGRPIFEAPADPSEPAAETR